jgi:hypothetical protein
MTDAERLEVLEERMKRLLVIMGKKGALSRSEMIHIYGEEAFADLLAEVRSLGLD